MKNNNFIEPIWEDAVTLCMSSSDTYAKYLSVLLESIKRNSCSEGKHYDVVILQGGSVISKNNLKLLSSIFDDCPSISLRFFDYMSFWAPIKSRVLEKYASTNRNFFLNSWARVFVPVIFQKYSRVIFTDCDLVFNADPADLFSIDMEGKPVLSAIEPVIFTFVSRNAVIGGRNMREYLSDTLELKDPTRYFNTGVMLMDIEACNSISLSDKCVDALLNEKKHFIWQEQDILTMVLGDDMGVLSPEWNWETITEAEANEASHQLGIFYENIKPKIVHYIARHKPWASSFQEPNSNYWWKNARSSPYYEEILKDRLLKDSSIRLKTIFEKLINDISGEIK